MFGLGVQELDSVIHRRTNILFYGFFSIQVITVCSVELPVLFSRSFLITYLIYGSVYVGEGNSTPLQYSCLENPMDGGAWWAAVHGVDKSRT